MSARESAGPAARHRFSFWVAITSVLGFSVWWIASILLHTALFGLLNAVVPERETKVPDAEGLSMTASPEQVKEVVDEIRSRKSEEFQQQLKELKDIQKELAEAGAAKVQQYNELMKSEAAIIPDTIRKASQEALAAQGEAMHAQDQAKTALAQLCEAQALAAAIPATEDPLPSKSSAEAAKSEVKKADDAASSAQSKVAAAQAQIEQQLDIFGKAANEVRSLNKTNIEQQQQASKLQKDAENSAQEASRSRAKEEALRSQMLADNARAQAEQKGQSEADAKIAALQSTLQAAGQPQSPELTQLLANQPKLKVGAERAVQAVNEDARKIADLAPATKAAIQQAQQLEEQAQRAQAQARESLSRSADQMALSVAKAGEHAPIPAPSSPEPNPAPPQNLAELYQQAIQAERSLTGTYKQVRAAELAAIRKLPMAEALALTDVAQPVRNDVDTKSLSAPIRDVQGVQAQEKAIIAASAELASMVDLARRMKGLAIPDSKTNIVVSDLKAQGDHIEAMEKLAIQSGGARAKDLTGEMVKAGTKEAKGKDSGGRGNGVAANGTINDNELSAAVFNPENLIPIPGRTIGVDMQATGPGRKGSWMFVDSWYLIGPWPNPGRKNLNKKYPPETVVDLNATYTGGRKDERPIPVRWKFFQAPATFPEPRRKITGQIIPPGLGEYEIYYAYTELWFDEARDLWVAIGSDDQSKIWINDEMIWKSSDEQKAWVANEGLRKVHFCKGINRILYRYENGHFGGCFSFWISLKSTVAAPL